MATFDSLNADSPFPLVLIARTPSFDWLIATIAGSLLEVAYTPGLDLAWANMATFDSLNADSPFPLVLIARTPSPPWLIPATPIPSSVFLPVRPAVAAAEESPS
jgi:hypothetical protein